MNLEEQLDFAVDFADELQYHYKDLIHSIDGINDKWVYSILPIGSRGAWVEVFADDDFDTLISRIRKWWGDPDHD